MDDLSTEASAGAPPDLTESAEVPTAAHLPTPDATPRPRRRWLLPVLLAPLVLLVVLVIAWAVDPTAGDVARNVQLAGNDIGGLSEAELAAEVDEVAAQLAAMPVELQVGDRTYASTAGEMGLSLDEDGTAEAALDTGKGATFVTRPFAWISSFFQEREATPVVRVSRQQVEAAVLALEGEARVAPTEPTVELVDGAFSVVPGVDGRGVDPEEVARKLPEAAQQAMAAGSAQIELAVEQRAIPPLGTEAAARRAAADAEALVGEPVEVVTSGGTRSIPSDELRRWVRLASNPDGSVVVSFDEPTTLASLRRAFADIDGRPVDATITLEGGAPVIKPDRPGLVCCAPGAAAQLLASLQGGERSVELELVEGAATFTAADAEEYGITQAVGGNNAWRDGAPTTAGPGFTTYHAASGARVTNIHRIADLVRGAVIPPGGSFSVNDYVGERTAEKGFVAAGAIRNGLHVDEIGGGISQFATTTFNAAYFAGLQIDAYQAHSEWFDRYPRGREATMGYPAPDLAFTNNTPYGILIWTSYTDTSLTVTLYSTPYATAEQTGIVERPSGRCTVVTTTRTVTFPDGHKEDDTFRATYRPGEGQSC